jgi:hypothetical protein
MLEPERLQFCKAADVMRSRRKRECSGGEGILRVNCCLFRRLDRIFMYRRKSEKSAMATAMAVRTNRLINTMPTIVRINIVDTSAGIMSCSTPSASRSRITLSFGFCGDRDQQYCHGPERTMKTPRHYVEEWAPWQRTEPNPARAATKSSFSSAAKRRELHWTIQ